jgi:dUTP pyrophosphatase
VTERGSTMQMVYLAAPIDQAGGNTQVMAFRQEAVIALRRMRMGYYDPARPFGVPANADPDDRIFKINHFALSSCDGFLGFMPGGVPSVGVPMEIEFARSVMGVPTAVVTDDVRSWSLRRPGLQLFEEVTDALEWLRTAMKENVRASARMWPIKVVCGPNGQPPTKHYEGDAGFDLYVSATTVVPPHEFVDIPCDVSVELPANTWAMITGRSSTLRSRGLLVHTAVIDQGYRGELFAGVWNLGREPNKVERGERIAQLIPLPLSARSLAVVEVAELGPSDRGETGFGSSGA